ncbi:hypothetical protein ACW2QC_19015 [Virgibacillus sp. FSP13]
MSSSPVFAEENTTEDGMEHVNKLQGYVDIENAETTMSEVLTFDEVVEGIAKDNNISKK